MRRVTLVVVAALVLAADLAPAQQATQRRFPRQWLYAGVGVLVTGAAALVYASSGDPDFRSPCSSTGCVTTASVVTGFVAGFLIGREVDGLYRKRYRAAPPLRVRGEAIPISVEPRALRSRLGTIAAAGEGGVELFSAGPRIERGDVRARGLRGIVTAVPDASTNRLLVATTTGLYGFRLAGGEPAGLLLFPGEVGALDARRDRAVMALGGALVEARLSEDSVLTARAPRRFSSPVTSVAWDPNRPIVWALTETALIALEVADTALADSLGAMAIPGTGRGMALGEGVIAVAAGEGGVLTVDASDPRQLRALGSWQGSRYAYDVALAPGALWLAGGPEGLFALTRNEDGSISPLGLARGLGFVSDLETDHNYLYVLDRSGNILRRIALAP